MAKFFIEIDAEIPAVGETIFIGNPINAALEVTARESFNYGDENAVVIKTRQLSPDEILVLRTLVLHPESPIKTPAWHERVWQGRD